MTKFYQTDLAFIHDVGFANFAVKSAPGLLAILGKYQIKHGLVVDLGCGSGLWPQELIKANYQVWGIDISPAMIDLAREKVPEAELVVGSIFQANMPRCQVVTAISECLNYLFDPNNNEQTLISLFERIYQALIPGGIFIFDVLEPGQIAIGLTIKDFRESEDWVIMVEKTENAETARLTRRIITFRKAGEFYRRSTEIHEAQLYKSEDLKLALTQVGFQVEQIDHYGNHYLGKNHAGFIAYKDKN